MFSVKFFLVLNTIENREARACGAHEFEIETTTLKGSSSCVVHRVRSSLTATVYSTIWISLDYSLLDLDLHA